MVRRLVVVLGDQLSAGLASLAAADKARDVVVMGEVAAEAAYAPHHRKKLVFIFAAMRRFAARLKAEGWTVDYTRLDDSAPAPTFTDLVAAAVARHAPARIVLVEPGEHRVLEEVRGWEPLFGLPTEVIEDDRFVCGHAEFDAWADGRKTLRMEYFYREMRRKTGLLMDGDAPAGGAWNFDAENRKPPGRGMRFPPALRFEPSPEVCDVIRLVKARFPDGFGDVEPFGFATSADEAEAAFEHFVVHALPQFGDYQDAMTTRSRVLFHALISPYLNVGLLDPLAVCRRAEAAFRAGRAPLNAVEGFIRQIIGWREYVRGIYWREGPDYVRRNALGATRALPAFYWTGETDMACVAAVVRQTREDAYAHHIQRLMVTGNFALIAGVDPHAVHEWYLGVYADAFEWVEAPNVIGMSQFADGGLLASKPYAASGAYINRMSDYCGGCRYAVARKTEDDACPFNALYWDFMLRNEKILARNGRVARAYDTWRRMDETTRAAYRARAAAILEIIDSGGRL